VATPGAPPQTIDERQCHQDDGPNDPIVDELHETILVNHETQTNSFQSTMNDDRTPDQTGKKQRGRFPPGVSGNLTGRPKGSGLFGQTRALIAEGVPAIIAKMQEQALAGDVAAARLLIERAVSAIKAGEESVRVDLGSGTYTERGEAVIRAVSEGELTPSQGAALMSGLTALVSLTEADDIKRRLAELEARTAGMFTKEN